MIVPLGGTKGTITKFDTENEKIKLFSVSNWGWVGKDYELIKKYVKFVIEKLD